MGSVTDQLLDASEAFLRERHLVGLHTDLQRVNQATGVTAHRTSLQGETTSVHLQNFRCLLLYHQDVKIKALLWRSQYMRVRESFIKQFLCANCIWLLVSCIYILPTSRCHCTYRICCIYNCTFCTTHCSFSVNYALLYVLKLFVEKCIWLTHCLCVDVGDIEERISSFGGHWQSDGQVQEADREVGCWNL